LEIIIKNKKSNGEIKVALQEYGFATVVAVLVVFGRLKKLKVSF